MILIIITCISLLTFLLRAHSFYMTFSLILTVLLSAYLFCVFYTKTWILMLVLLLYLGGVLVLFLYLTSLNPKKVFLQNKLWYLLILFVPVVPVFLTKRQLTWNSIRLGVLMFSYRENFTIALALLALLLYFLFVLSFRLITTYLPIRNL